MTPRAPETAAQWQSYFDLRWRLLRAPWNEPPGSERDELDDQRPGVVHAMLCDHRGDAISVGRMQLNSPEEAQIRYMATAEAFQGQGLGRLVVRYLEQAAAAAGAQTMVLNARDSAVPFYVRLGYQIAGDGPVLFGGVKHVRMSKRLEG